jgi:hypothetical protein
VPGDSLAESADETAHSTGSVAKATTPGGNDHDEEPPSENDKPPVSPEGTESDGSAEDTADPGGAGGRDDGNVPPENGLPPEGSDPEGEGEGQPERATARYLGLAELQTTPDLLLSVEIPVGRDTYFESLYFDMHRLATYISTVGVETVRVTEEELDPTPPDAEADPDAADSVTRLTRIEFYEPEQAAAETEVSHGTHVRIIIDGGEFRRRTEDAAIAGYTDPFTGEVARPQSPASRTIAWAGILDGAIKEGLHTAGTANRQAASRGGRLTWVARGLREQRLLARNRPIVTYRKPSEPLI